MAFTWFDVVVLFGILQGILSAVLLWKRKPISISQKLFACILLVFSLLSCKIALHTLGLWDSPALRYFPLGIDLLIQPLLFLYVSALLKPHFTFGRKEALHLLPPLLFMLHAIMVYVIVLPVNNLTAKDVIAENFYFNSIKTIEDYLSVISSVVYGVMSLIAVQRYRKWLQVNISGSNYPSFNWIKHVLIFTGVLGLGVFINIVLDQAFHFDNGRFIHWQLFYTYLSCLIYYMAYHSYQQKEVSQLPHQENVTVVKESTISAYPAEVLQAAKVQLLQALRQQQLYLNSELTLITLATHVGLSTALISEVINKDLGKTFRTLINELRVEEVKLKLLDAGYSHLSILGIAYECGFNSEASFYRIFKSATGMSPKTFIVQNTSAAVNRPVTINL